jgi:predicted RNase H-like HicB family nuclease
MGPERAYTVLVHPDVDGSYWAEVQALPGCFGSGKTLDAVQVDIKQVIEVYIGALRELGQDVPERTLDAPSDESVRQWAIRVA